MRCLAFALLLVLPPAIGDDPAKAELDRHQGTWRAVEFVRDGKSTPEAIVSTITRTVEGDRIVWKREGKSFAATSVKLDPMADPKAIDVIPEGGQLRDQTVRGIYKLDGDVLTICMVDPDRPRPTAFEAPQGSGTTLMTFRKVEGPAPSPRQPGAK